MIEGERAPERARTEAQVLARRIRELLDAGLPVFDPPSESWPEGRWRDATPGDIAILLRQRTYLAEYEAALRAERLPAAAQQGRGLYQRPEIMDAAALLRWLADPADDLALLALLRGPCVSLDDSECLTLLQQRGRSETLWDTLQRFRQRAGSPVGWLQPLLKAKTHVSAARLLTLALQASGGMHPHAAQPDGRQRLANLQVLYGYLHAWAQEGDRDVQCASARLQRLIQQGAAAPEAPSAERDAVQLLTIHGAKGLEFPIVVIPDAHRTAGYPQPGLTLDNEFGIGLNHPTVQGAPQLVEIKRHRLQQEEEEAERLHYVALTRARHHLIVSLQTTPKQRPDKVKLLQAYAASGAQLRLDHSQELQVSVLKVLPRTLLPDPLPTPELISMVLPTAYPVTALETYRVCPRQFEQRFIVGVRPLVRLAVPAPSGQAAGPTAAEIGQAVHHALQDDLSAQDIAHTYAQWPPAARRRVAWLTQRFAQHPAFQGLQLREERELPLHIPLGALSLRGQIDAYSPSQRLIIDYKTDRQIGPERHLLQVAVYAHHLGAERAALAYLWPGVVHEFSSQELKEGYLQALELAEGIASGQFKATPAAEVCTHCELRSSCPAKRRA